MSGPQSSFRQSRASASPTICIYSRAAGGGGVRKTANVFADSVRHVANLGFWHALGIVPFVGRADRSIRDWADQDAVQLDTEDLFRRRLGIDPRVINFAWGELDDARVSAVNNQCSLFVVVGGYFGIDDAGRLPAHVSSDETWFRRIQVPIIGLGLGLTRCTVGRLPHPIAPEADDAARIEAVVNRMTQISVRDRQTARMIETLTARKPSLVPSASFVQRGRGASVRMPAAPESGRIGLSLGPHDRSSASITRLNLSRYVDLARSLLARYGGPLVYFVHAEDERIFPRVLAAEGIPVQTVGGSLAQVLAEYSKLDIHVCRSLQSAELAISSGVPTLNLADDAKTAGFFDLVEMKEFCLPIVPLIVDDVMSRVNELVQNRDVLSRRLRLRCADLSRDLDQAVDRSIAAMAPSADNGASPSCPSLESVGSTWCQSAT